MASKKKLIQSSKIQNILEDYSFVLFIQQPQKKYIKNLEKLVVKTNSNSITNEKSLRLFRSKNTLIEKCILNIENQRKLNNDGNSSMEFQNIFQGPNMLVAGKNLEQLPTIWKSLNSIPHLFFCGALINNNLYNHLDLEKAIECVYNTSSEEVYNRLVTTLIDGIQLNSLARDFEMKVSAFFNLDRNNINI